VFHKTAGRTDLHANSAAGTDIPIDHPCVVLAFNGLYRAAFGANTALRADIDLIDSRCRKMPDDFERRFFGIIFPELRKGADRLTGFAARTAFRSGGNNAHSFSIPFFVAGYFYPLISTSLPGYST
jgi:hypothetical protein